MAYIIVALLIASDSYEFVADRSIEYTREISHTLYFGHLDECGNYVPIPDLKPIDISRGHPKSMSRPRYPLFMTFSAQDEVYEYRSGRLIPGVIRMHEFAPDIGGKIIELIVYKYSKDARRIYNLPGKFVLKGNDKGRSEDSKLPQKNAHTPPPARIAEKKVELARPPTTNEEYEFKLTPSVEYSRKFGNYLYFGTLDEYGNFKPAIDTKPIDISKGAPKEDGKYIPLMSHISQKEVYEFRFRTLIPGTIQNGEFIPDLGGGKIIDFADYKYSKDAKPIYNLPGKFYSIPKEK